jgi:hypothetical protein
MSEYQFNAVKGKFISTQLGFVRKLRPKLIR